MKLFLSILYLTEMKTLTYDIKNIIPTLDSHRCISAVDCEADHVIAGCGIFRPLTRCRFTNLSGTYAGV